MGVSQTPTGQSSTSAFVREKDSKRTKNKNTFVTNNFGKHITKNEISLILKIIFNSIKLM